jgi:orotidine-5'-phosphate decarboxylase
MSNIPAGNFADRLCLATKAKESHLCVGLDPQLGFMPTHLIEEVVARNGQTLAAMGELFFSFNVAIIDAVADIAVAVKPQLAFYEAYGSEGIRAFERTVQYAQSQGLLVVADAKRGDGGPTAEAYASSYLGEVPFFGGTELSQLVSPMRVDCMTVHGWIGEAGLTSFIEKAKQFGSGVFVVCKTSFKPNSLIEQLICKSGVNTNLELRVWEHLAIMVRELGEGTEGASGYRNVGVVMGATKPEDAPRMREILPKRIFLIPGLGKQGGAADDAVVGINEDGFGGLVNDSRRILMAWKEGPYKCDSTNFATATRKQAIEARDALLDACRRAGKWPY